MEIIARNVLGPGGLTREQHASMERVEKAAYRSMNAESLMRSEGWEWFERLCVSNAEHYEAMVLNPPKDVDVSTLNRCIASAAVWRSVPGQVEKYKKKYEQMLDQARDQHGDPHHEH